MKLTFLGAAREVTGSQHLLETDRVRLLLDCGLFQGPRAETYSKNIAFRCDPPNLDGLILSHAHIDHCGNLPGLFRAGFRGPIFCTRATADFTGLALENGLHIQREDARYLSEHEPSNRLLEPLYEEEHVRGIVKLLEPLDYAEWHELSPALRVRFWDAGHLLGSAITELDVRDGSETKRVVFTGDLGRRGLPLLRDPQLVGGCDVLITESTYGNTIHPPAEELKSHLLRIIKRADAEAGKVIIPAFSLGRTQQVIFFLHQLSLAGELPRMPVFVDSPLAGRMTAVYRQHHELMDADATRMLGHRDDLFDFPMLTNIASQRESAALNRREGPFVVISASGMCENGRVRHHLKHAVDDERNAVVLIGFQAQNTLGRRIAERQPTLRILDRVLPLRARVETLHGLSAHADAEDFKWFFSHMAKDRGIGQAFIVHGEPGPANALSTLIHDFCDEDPIIPALYQSFEV